jgi:hypothetical protein
LRSLNQSLIDWAFEKNASPSLIDWAFEKNASPLIPSGLATASESVSQKLQSSRASIVRRSANASIKRAAPVISVASKG